MTKREWRELWLEIAENIVTDASARDEFFCLGLKYRGFNNLTEVVGDMSLWVGGDHRGDAWYSGDNLGNDYAPTKAFTACFIAEIGEREFMALAKED